MLGMKETKLLRFSTSQDGLISNERVRDRAVRISSFKEGRMPVGKAVGVFVGVHEHGLAGLEINMAHYVDTKAFERRADKQKSLRSSAMRMPLQDDRKGYSTFRCGDI
eukprot:6194996-Pleurochrysis_carterae.AAC.1